MPRWLRLWSGPLAAVVVLVALIAVWRHAQTAPPPAAGTSSTQALQVVDVKASEVTQITIQAAGGRLVLARVNLAKGGAQWRIGGPSGKPASAPAVDSLLGSLAPLTADRTVPATGNSMATFGLSPAQRTLTLGLAGGGSLQLEIGAQSPVGSYYALVQGDPTVYLIPTTVPDSLQTAAQAWLPAPAAGGAGATAPGGSASTGTGTSGTASAGAGSAGGASSGAASGGGQAG